MYWHICVSRGDLNKSILKLLKKFNVNDGSMDKSAHYRSYINFGTEHQLKLDRAKQHFRDSCTKMFSSKYMRVRGVKFSVGSIFANSLCFLFSIRLFLPRTVFSSQSTELAFRFVFILHLLFK